MEKKAMFFEPLSDSSVICRLCPHRCHLQSGQKGICRVRENQNGELISLFYGMVSSIALDPIEKKPLYHFFPGSEILSVGTVGCNLKCSFCQNYSISQFTELPLSYYSKEEIENICLKNNCRMIAFTYSEPMVWYETIFDYFCYFKTKGFYTVLVTNGFINSEPLREILPFIDAMNIDLKGFTDDFYEKICKGKLDPVIKTVETAFQKCWVEVTTLIVPGENDTREEIRKISLFLSSLSKDIPLHISRYYPQYKMKKPPTDERHIIELADEAKKYLSYVYTGNFYGGYGDTVCPICGNLIVKRKGFQSFLYGLDNGRCSKCHGEIPIIN